MMDWTDCPIVTTDPAKLGGEPTLRDTRLPISAITDNYDDGVGLPEIAALFDVDEADVSAILMHREGVLGPLE
jgi:uncharacterized protein (DUF433 family)